MYSEEIIWSWKIDLFLTNVGATFIVTSNPENFSDRNQ